MQKLRKRLQSGFRRRPDVSNIVIDHSAVTPGQYSLGSTIPISELRKHYGIQDVKEERSIGSNGTEQSQSAYHSSLAFRQDSNPALIAQGSNPALTTQDSNPALIN